MVKVQYPAPRSGVLESVDIQSQGILTPCLPQGEVDDNGVAGGLDSVGYDLHAILEGDAQEIVVPPHTGFLAGSYEHFDIPLDVVGVCTTPSSLLRKWITAQHSLLKPGWNGYLTLEVYNQSSVSFVVQRHAVVAYVYFMGLTRGTKHGYSGSYQNQEYGPQHARK